MTVALVVAAIIIFGIAVKMYVSKGNKGGSRKPTRSEHDLPK